MRLGPHHCGSLRRKFSNPTPKLKSLISRWKRGVYRVSQRADNTPIHDVRGPCVRRIGKPQTFRTPAEVDRLVDDYPGQCAHRSLQGVATGLLDDHLKHCVLDAAKLSDEAAHEKIQESTAAVNRLIRS